MMRNILACLALLCIQLTTKPVYGQIIATANPPNGGVVHYVTSSYSGNFSSARLYAVANAGYVFSGVYNIVDQWGNSRTYGSFGTNELTFQFQLQKAEGSFLKLYSISAVSMPAGAGTVTGTGPNPETRSASLTAVPAAGYGLKDWTIGGTVVSTNVTYDHPVSRDTTVMANFTKLVSIDVSISLAGAGTVSGSGMIASSRTTALTATPASGYVFAGWNEGGKQISTANPYSFIVTNPRTLVAVFKKLFAITTTAKPVEGAAKLTGAGEYFYKDSITVKAVAATGYNFVNWTQGGTEVSTSAEYSFSVNQMKNLVANFKGVPCTITTSMNPANFGTLTNTVTNTATYDYGQSVTLKATPADGIDFTAWLEGGKEVSTSADYTFTATKNRNLVARFKKPFMISVATNPASSGTMTGAGKYYYNDTARLNAVAGDGYKFKNWTLNGTEVSTTANYNFTVTKEGNFIANFIIAPFSISSKANPAGSGTVNGTGTGNFNRNATVNLTATAASGFHFLCWTENDIVISTTPSLSFPADRSRKLVAQFTKYSIGELNQGGVIFHLWNDSLGGMHGLAVAINDQATKISWREGGTGTTGALSTTDGLDNCRKIVAYRNSGNSAAKICMDYRGSALSDWYLPAIDELKLLYDALPKGVNAKLNESNGQFVVGSELNSRNYWSSTETSSSIPAGNTIYYVSFYDGKQVGTTYYGPYPCNVRAIRKF